MEINETVTQMLAETARELGVGEPLPDGASGGEFSFGTTAGDPVKVVLTHDEANGCFNLCAHVGDAPSDDYALFEELLAQNYLGRATDGAVFAVDPEGAVVLQRDLALAGLDASALAEIARSIAGHAASVRTAIAVRQSEGTELSICIKG